MNTPPASKLTPSQLRHRFNTGRYWEKVQTGELTEFIIRDGHPSPPLAPEPVCTRSQIEAYLNPAGERIAVVHQYLRNDGSLGASGRPDPKRLMEDGILYFVEEPK